MKEREKQYNRYKFSVRPSKKNTLHIYKAWLKQSYLFEPEVLEHAILFAFWAMTTSCFWYRHWGRGYQSNT